MMDSNPLPTISQLLSAAEICVPGSRQEYLALCDEGQQHAANLALRANGSLRELAKEVKPYSVLIPITRPVRDLEAEAQRANLDEWEGRS